MVYKNGSIWALFVQTLHSKIDTSHPKMDQLVGFLLHPPLSEIAKKLGKILKYTPHFQSAFSTADCNASCQSKRMIQTNTITFIKHYKLNIILQSDLCYPRNSIIRGFWGQNLVRQLIVIWNKVRPPVFTPLLSADLGYPRVLRPKFSTPKYRG